MKPSLLLFRFEDGDLDSTTLIDTNLRKMQRLRHSTDKTERRKSRRFTTGSNSGHPTSLDTSTNDNGNYSTLLSPPSNPIDEDSSSSTNSTEFNGGVFAEKKRKYHQFPIKR